MAQNEFSIIPFGASGPPGLAGVRWYQGTAIPAAGLYYNVGDIIWNPNPAGGQPISWVCITAGAGGTAVFMPEYTEQFGSSTLSMFPEGNVYRNIGNPIAGNAADTTDDILLGFALPANVFDISGRGIFITAQGKTGATGNNKKYRLWINPTMSGQTTTNNVITGGTVSGAGSGVMLLDSTVQTSNALGWSLQGNLFKYGAAGSNTQYFQGSIINAASHAGINTPSFLTQAENAVMNIVVTGSSSTTGAANDVILNFFEINAMN
jgi:hypothetical protein